MDTTQSDVFGMETRVEMAAMPAGPYSQRPRTDGLDHRKLERAPVTVEVGLHSESSFYTGFTENISTGGLFVATRDLMPIGTAFNVTFTLPNYPQSITARCEVRWQRLEQLDNPDCLPGMGVRFMHLSPTESDAINDFLQMRDTLFYDDED
ncbi:MAG: TIGR02266 family protein [Deltaproteobacteria bacterium]|nr:TIGR02266 family protein [Deltaproteobacteria bacterium]MCB9786729.1 TIGR02266 family protein [Deltaproteobacteria bacterium]